MNLINKLKLQHREMKTLADSMLSISKSAEERKEIFAKLMHLMAEHRNIEDTMLYPVLIEKSQTDKELWLKLDVFASDWQEISAFSKVYINKYAEAPLGDDFLKDTGKLYANLRIRTSNEESELFPEYEKLVKP
jgi:hypothetical protein